MTDIRKYRQWRASRRAGVAATGFEVDPRDLHPSLRDDQRAVVAWALKRGRAALFINTGGGKAFDLLEWNKQVARLSGKRCIMFAPLAVADQLVREGERWGIEIAYVRDQAQADETKCPIVISNYELMDRFTPSAFVAVSMDESSIIKHSDSQTRNMVNKMWAHTPYRLFATATPAPNEYDELGNHSQALGIMPWHEMITRWFIRDSDQADTLRLKGHARRDFWRWVASWAVCMTKPSDLGFDDTGFDLPPLNVHHITVDQDPESAWETGRLFHLESLSATEMHANKRATLKDRCEKAADIVNAEPSEPCVVWVETNDEADAMQALLPDAIEVRGNDALDDKRATLRAFSEGRERVLITKLGIAGFGMNWQHCRRTVFASMSFSFERTYQGLKRFHRYGQTRPVDAYMITAANEANIARSYRDKERQFVAMQLQMNDAMREVGLLANAPRFDDYDYNPTRRMNLPPFVRTKEPIYA